MQDRLFFGVFRSMPIRNQIFSVMKSMKYEFKSPLDYHIKNRIGLDKIRSLGWYISRNQFTLLKDRLLYWCNDKDYLLVKEKHIGSLLEKCTDDMELLSLVYEIFKSQLVGYDLVYLATTNNNVNAVKLFTEKYQKTTSNKSFVHALKSSSLEIVKYLLEHHSNSFLPSEIIHHNGCINLKTEIYQCLVEKDIFKNEKVPLVDFKLFCILQNQQFSEYILNRDLVITNLGNIQHFAEISYMKFNDGRLPNLKSIFNKINLNYQNFHNTDQHQLISIIDKEFKISQYPLIYKLLLSVLVWYDYESIDSIIQQFKSTFQITELKKSIFTYYSVKNIDHENNHGYIVDDINIQRQFSHLKIMIKYQHYSSTIINNKDGTLVNSYEGEKEPILKWWEMKLIKFKEFTFDQVLELIELIKSNGSNYSSSLDRLFELLYGDGSDSYSSLPDYLNQVSNSLKLYETFKSHPQLFIKCLNHSVSNLELESMKLLFDHSNNDVQIKRIIYETIEFKFKSNACSIDQDYDQTILEILDLILEIKSNQSYHINHHNLFYSLSNSIIDKNNLIIAIHKIKSSTLNHGTSHFTSFKELLEALVDPSPSGTDDALLFGNWEFIQILINQFLNDIGYKVALSILGHQYNGDTYQSLELLIDKAITITNDNGNRVAEALEILGKSKVSLPFIQLFAKQFDTEIKEQKVIQDLYFLSPDTLLWVLNNYGNLFDSPQYLSKLVEYPFTKIDDDYIECIITVFNYIKSNSLVLPTQLARTINKEISNYIYHSIVKEKSIKMFRFFIQTLPKLYLVEFHYLFKQLLSPYISQDNQIMSITDNQILNLIESLNILNVPVCTKAVARRIFGTANYKQPTTRTTNINKEIKNFIQTNQLYRLVLIGEFKLAIQLYSKLKSSQSQYKKSYDTINDEESIQPLKTFISIKNFKSIIKYQELDIAIGLFEMTSRYYGPYACNQLVRFSLLYGRLDIYNYFKSLHYENSEHINRKFKRGIITIGFLYKLTNSNYFYSFLERGDLPMFKFLLDQYLNHHHTITQHTDQHIHNLIYNLSNINPDRLNEIFNYLSNTFPQYVNREPKKLEYEDQNQQLQTVAAPDHYDIDILEFYDQNIHNKYLNITCGHQAYYEYSLDYNNESNKENSQYESDCDCDSD